MTNIAAIKMTAAGRWPEILSTLGGIPLAMLDGKHHPCPKCGGKDRFRMIDDKTGSLFCNQCFDKKNGDGLAAMKWATGEDFATIVTRLAEYLGVDANGNNISFSNSNIVRTYDYCDEQGVLLYQVCRMLPKGFRQRKPKPGGGWDWHVKGIRKVPYCLPELLAADPSKTVFIVEGEKDVNSLVERNLIATCNSGGAGKWLPDFNQHLRGRRVVILPDKDMPGRKHAQQIASGLQGIAAEVKVVELPGSGKDVSDWLDDGGTVEELFEITKAVPTAKIVKSKMPQWRPFPTDALPEPIRTYVVRASAAIGIDPSYIATALLPALAGAIGNSRLIMLKRGWTEPTVLWGVLVGDSGTMKSPAIDIATKYVRERQEKAINAYQQAMEVYSQEHEQFQAKIARSIHGEKYKCDRQLEEPNKPICERLFCSDVTIEGLAVLLADAWRGLLLVRDELAGWIGGFDQYKGGRGSDTAHWLTIHGARDLLVDRKGTDRRMIFARRAAVSIVGGIQPGTLNRVLGQKHFENGLAARLLLAMPPRQTKQWTETEIDETLDQSIGRLFDRLYAIEPAIDDNNQPVPVSLSLSPSGKAAWVKFYNEHAERQANAIGNQASSLSKIEGAAARIALIFHCVRHAVGDENVSDYIDEKDICSGVILAEWYADEAERVYHAIQETDEGRLWRQVLELIKRRSGKITANDLRRRSRHFESSESADRFLNELVRANLGTWTPIETTEAGGRPSREFQLFDSVSASQTSELSKVNDISDTDVVQSGDVDPLDFHQSDSPIVSFTPSKIEEEDVSDTEPVETLKNSKEFVFSMPSVHA